VTIGDPDMAHLERLFVLRVGSSPHLSGELQQVEYLNTIIELISWFIKRLFNPWEGFLR
jgi:hypothetical protein